jgi:hypothetical protein
MPDNIPWHCGQYVRRKMSHRDTGNIFIRYFKNPLGGVSAMTAYNLPNSAVHIPVIIMFVYAGVCISRVGVKPLLAVYFVVALYAARDLMIISYKNKVVPVIIWGIFIPFIVFHKKIASYLTLDSQQDSVILTLAVLAGFIVYIPIYIKKFLRW